MISEHKSHNFGYDIIYCFSVDCTSTAPGNVKLGDVTLSPVVQGVMTWRSDASLSSDAACAGARANVAARRREVEGVGVGGIHQQRAMPASRAGREGRVCA